MAVRLSAPWSARPLPPGRLFIYKPRPTLSTYNINNICRTQSQRSWKVDFKRCARNSFLNTCTSNRSTIFRSCYVSSCATKLQWSVIIVITHLRYQSQDFVSCPYNIIHPYTSSNTESWLKVNLWRTLKRAECPDKLSTQALIIIKTCDW
jgi:hypothetical protein